VPRRSDLLEIPARKFGAIYGVADIAHFFMIINSFEVQSLILEIRDSSFSYISFIFYINILNLK